MTIVLLNKHAQTEWIETKNDFEESQPNWKEMVQLMSPLPSSPPLIDKNPTKEWFTKCVIHVCEKETTVLNFHFYWWLQWYVGYREPNLFIASHILIDTCGNQVWLLFLFFHFCHRCSLTEIVLFILFSSLCHLQTHKNDKWRSFHFTISLNAHILRVIHANEMFSNPWKISPLLLD